MIADFNWARSLAKSRAQTQEDLIRSTYCIHVAHALAQYLRRSSHTELHDLDVQWQQRVNDIAEYACGLVEDAKRGEL